jgi:hypothetical protein
MKTLAALGLAAALLGGFFVNGHTQTFNGLYPPVSAPQGRLTALTAVPVITRDTGGGVAGAATVYYTPYLGNQASLWNGSIFVPTTFSELSNVLANSATGNAGPFAAADNAVYDLFIWNNAGTPTLTRGDMWQQTATVTNTNASPAVFTHTGHLLAIGMPVRLTVTGGSLSPNFTANTTYYIVAAGFTANTYTLAATPGGTAINAGGAATGTITAVEGLGASFLGALASGRGTAPALVRTNGAYVNNVAIANGPAAGFGLYVGSILTNSSGTVDFILGSGNSPAPSLGVWNNYNRVGGGTNVIDFTAQYTYTSGTVRAANNNTGNSITFLIGLREDPVLSTYYQRIVTVGAASAFGNILVYFDGSVDQGPSGVVNGAVSSGVAGTPNLVMNHNALAIGAHQFSAMEQGDGTNANLFGATGSFIGGTLSLSYRN